MATIAHSPEQSVGMGLMSVVLGSVGLLLFFLPVLCIPLAAAGLAFGVVGFLMAIFGGWSSLRWSVAGIVVCGISLGIGIVIAITPLYYSQNPEAPAVRQMVPDYRPYVPPPARPGA